MVKKSFSIVVTILIAFFFIGTILTSVSARDSPSSNQTVRTGPSSRPNFETMMGTSLNWSGYVAESSIPNPANGFINAVMGSWTVPALTPDPSGENTYVSIWVGIDGYSNTTVEQIGTAQEIVDGEQQNYAWFETYPQPTQVLFTVNNGDAITASVAYVGSNTFTLSISDITTGQSYSENHNANALRRSAEWIVEAPSLSGILPLANFGTVEFDNAQFTDNNGSTYAIDGRGPGTYDAITMINPHGGAAMPSGLTDNAGASSFTVEYEPYWVDVSISPDNQNGVPGRSITYTITIKNLGNLKDNYDITVADNYGWGLALDSDRFENLLPEESSTTTLRVTIPDNTSPGTIDNIRVTATSQGDPSVKDNTSCIALSINGFALDMVAGWNLVCFPVDNSPTTPNRIFIGLTYPTNYTIYSWSAPGGPYSLVGATDNLKDNLGYWVYIDTNKTLAWGGTRPTSRDVHLLAGWNLVGFPIDNAGTTPNNKFTGLIYLTNYVLYSWTASSGPYKLVGATDNLKDWRRARS